MQIGRQTCWVLWRLKELRERLPGDFDSNEAFSDTWTVRRPVKYLQALKQIFKEASEFLESSKNADFNYCGLLQAHLVVAVFS